MRGDVKIKQSIVLFAVITVIAALYFAAVGFFPLKYSAEVREAGEKFDLDENLIRAVILTESGYDESAVSSAGAEGLMQLMPSTRRWISETSGIPSDGSARSEILLGSAYLRYLLDLTGDETDALMSYNAGYSNVLKWKQGGTPFPETVEYVRKVRFFGKIYALL